VTNDHSFIERFRWTVQDSAEPSCVSDLRPAIVFRGSVGSGLNLRILALLAASVLMLPGVSKADSFSAVSLDQPSAPSATQDQNHQSAACPMMQNQQSGSCPMHHSEAAKAENAGNEASQQGQDPKSSHAAGQSMNHPGHDAMNQRGNTGMGFDQQKTTHHFLILEQGGAIEVQANDSSDAESRDQIRAHLNRIAEMFSRGDFAIPMFVHDQTPPGVDLMKQLKEAIHYEYQEIDRGGRLAISTHNPEALAAIHAFLRFQIREHKTGDSLDLIRK